MKNQIEKLQKENTEKTIYKDSIPYLKASALNIIAFALVMIFAFLLLRFG